MKNPIKLSNFAFLLLLVMVFSSCQTVYRSGFVDVPRQVISGPIEIGSDWIEIIPPNPLIPYGTSQNIELEFIGNKKSDFAVDNEKEENTSELADGRTTKIEAFLFDDTGQSYELKVRQTSRGTELIRKGKVKWDGEPYFSHPDYSEVDFPSNRVFTKLKIRSEIALNCTYLVWTGNNPK